MNDFLSCVIFCCQNGSFPVERLVISFKKILFHSCAKKYNFRYFGQNEGQNDLVWVKRVKMRVKRI